MLKHLAAIALASAAIPTLAESHDVEWRLLGPAWSFHASNDRAPIRRQTYGVLDCRQDTSGSGSHCTGSLVPAERAWSGTNPAIGVQATLPSESGASSRDFVYGTAVRDSYGKMGLMLAAGRMWNIFSWGTLDVGAGAAAGLWYRTVDNGMVRKERVRFCPAGMAFNSPQCPPSNWYAMETQLKRRIVPFVLPVLALTESYTGLGVNLGLVPRIRFGRYETTPTSTLMVQFTYKVAF